MCALELHDGEPKLSEGSPRAWSIETTGGVQRARRLDEKKDEGADGVAGWEEQRIDWLKNALEVVAESMGFSTELVWPSSVPICMQLC